MKPLVFALGGLFIIILMIPTLLVTPYMEQSKGQLAEELKPAQKEKTVLAESQVDVPVYRSQQKLIEDIPLEEYVVGVVASEMPADFEDEALKAQALAARTYIVKQMMNEEPVISAPEGSLVTDTQIHQVYKGVADLKEQWKDQYNNNMEKVTAAVAATQGQILTYEDKPIDALFFSTSNGFTENSEAYWKSAFPYLKSVDSSWDKDSPKFHDKKIVSIGEFEKILGVKLSGDGSVGKIVEKTPGNRVATVEINGKKFSGRQIREKLELRSSDFKWEIKDNQVVISTKGFGHGVGMSQYGANFMAEDGKTFNEILSHYYKGTEIAGADTFLTKYTAQN